MLQHKSFSKAQNRAFMVFDTWVKTKDAARLTALKDYVGVPMFRILGYASMNENVEALEKEAKIPTRSGKAIVGLVADTLDNYLKGQDLRIG